MAETLRGLVAAAQRGDAEALGALAGCVDRFQRMFRGSLSPQVRRAQGSTIDFVLEGVARALAEIGRFEYESDEHFYAWITRAIRGRIIDGWRGESRQKRAGRPVSLEARVSDPAARDASISEEAGRRELREAIANAVLEEQLVHPQEMEVVVLKVFDGESWSGIRNLLELSSEQKARTLFARGLDLLRVRIRDRFPALRPGDLFS